MTYMVRCTEYEIRRNVSSCILLLCLLFLACATSAQTPGTQLSTVNKKALKAFDEAMQAYQKRDYPRAITEVTLALQADSLFCEALILKGDLFSDLKKPAEAISSYKNVLRINPSFSNRVLNSSTSVFSLHVDVITTFGGTSTTNMSLKIATLSLSILLRFPFGVLTKYN